VDRDSLDRGIISGDIKADPVGAKLTPQAQERATEFGMSLRGQGMNWGQIREASIKHVTADVLRDT
jgi:hypothetical protein